MCYRESLCISSAERFYKLLKVLLEKRGKQDFAIRIHHKTAAARGVLPYGPHGPAIFGFGRQHFDDGYSQGYPGGYEDDFYSDGYGYEDDRRGGEDDQYYEDEDRLADEGGYGGYGDESRYGYEEGFGGYGGGYPRYPPFGRRRPFGRRPPPKRRYKEDSYNDQEGVRKKI